VIALAVAILFLPGCAIAVLAGGDEKDPVCFLAAAAISGAALAMILPWFSGAPAGLVRPAIGAALAACVLLAVFWRRTAQTLKALDWRGAHGPALLVIAVLAMVRLVPFGLAETAPGADMSMHSYTARLILDADRIPSGYRPLLPVDTFGASAPGLPTLGALISALSGSAASDGTFLAACLAFILLSLALYAFVRVRASSAAAVVGMLIVTAAARDPQAMFEWGGNATVLSLALVTYGLLLIERLGEPDWRRLVVPAALVLGASVLAHTVIPYAVLFVLPLVLVFRLRRPGGSGWRGPAPRWLAVAGAAAVVLLPYIARFQAPVGPDELNWIRQWQSRPMHVPLGPTWAYPVTSIWYVVTRLGIFCAAWIAAALVARRWIPSAPIGDDLLMAGLALALVVNARFWILPASYALYPDRVVLLLTPVAARVIGISLDGWNRRRSRRARFAGALAVGASVAAGMAIWFIPAMASVAVTADDREAIRWIEVHAPENGIIENNYGDAGIWIPALANRAVCSPHVNIIYMEELESWRRGARPVFLFVGARRVIESGSPFTRPAVALRPDRYIEAFRRGDAAVYRVVPDPAGMLPPCAPSTAVSSHPH
jgi:hypothetical protein